MLFWQQYSRQEYGHGEQVILFAVSNIITELTDFANYTAAQKTDIFLLDLLKQDLNIDKGAYAVDELTFKINHLTCRNDTDNKALYFCIDSADRMQSRFVAIFFDSVSLDNMMFIGKLNGEIQGDDKLWTAGFYNSNIDAKRVYSFTANSLDVTLLEYCKINSKIQGLSGENIDNCSERWGADWGSVFSDMITTQATPWQAKFRNMAYLYDVISKYLEYSQAILSEGKNVSINIELKNNTDLGISTSPAILRTYIDKDITDIKHIVWSWASKRFEVLKLSNIHSAEYYAPIINVKMISPYFDIDEDNEEEQLLVGSASNLSFLRIDSVADLIYDIARSFGCYVFMRYVTGNKIEIEIKSRTNIVDEHYTVIRAVKQASVESSGEDTSSNKLKYYSQTNDRAGNFPAPYTKINSSFGFGQIVESDKITFNLKTENLNHYTTNGAILQDIENSKDLETESKARKIDEDKNNVKYERILFSHSLPISRIIVTHRSRTLKELQEAVAPHNNPFKNLGSRTGSLHIVPMNLHPINGMLPSVFNTVPDLLHTGIYIKVSSPEAANNGYIVTRPASKVLAKINNENKQFETLADYVSEIIGIDELSYETEYELTVPFWNGFIRNAVESWKSIKLGSKIQFSEPIKTYKSGSWQDDTFTREYIVVGIERNLNTPETKLKLHSKDRFAWGTFDGSATGADSNDEFLEGTEVTDDDVATYIVDDGASVIRGRAVAVLPNGKVTTANENTLNHTVIGIAIETRAPGETIPVQLQGIYTYDSDIFTNFNIKATVKIGGGASYYGNLLNIVDSVNMDGTLLMTIGTVKNARQIVIQTQTYKIE